jgi:hypothetical protein
VSVAPMRFAYADPPYLGCGHLYADHHEHAGDCDDPEWHRDLIDRLVRDFPDGWALSASSPSLATLLPMCPEETRLAAWVKPFASFKPGVNPAYAWEPVLFRGGRKRGRSEPTVRDFHSAPITLRKGLPGAKPHTFNRWIIDLMGALPSDEFVDLFPGTDGFGAAWDAFRGQPRYEPGSLFAKRMAEEIGGERAARVLRVRANRATDQEDTPDDR